MADMVKDWSLIFYHIFLVIIGGLANVIGFYIIKPQGLLTLIILPLIVFILLGLLNRPGIMGFIDMVAVIIVSSLIMRLLSDNFLWLLVLNPYSVLLGLFGVFVGYILQGILR